MDIPCTSGSHIKGDTHNQILRLWCSAKPSESMISKTSDMTSLIIQDGDWFRKTLVLTSGPHMFMYICTWVHMCKSTKKLKMNAFSVGLLQAPWLSYRKKLMTSLLRHTVCVHASVCFKAYLDFFFSENKGNV